jgi:hypothetical protein
MNGCEEREKVRIRIGSDGRGHIFLVENVVKQGGCSQNRRGTMRDVAQKSLVSIRVLTQLDDEEIRFLGKPVRNRHSSLPDASHWDIKSRQRDLLPVKCSLG